MKTILLAVALAAACAGAARAQTPRAPLSLVIGTSAGGGYDLYGRLAARHLGRFLPGEPQVVPSNMPGAGQLILANWLYAVAPRDGSTIGQVPSTTAFDGLFGNAQAHYDATKFNWIGSLDGYITVAAVWADSPIKTAEDFLTKKVVLGGGAPASDVTIWPKLVNSLLGAKLEIVSGYVGTAQITLAIERGEVQGMLGADWHGIELSKPDWVRDRKIRIVMQFVGERSADLPDTPTSSEFVRDPRAAEILKLFYARQLYGRPLAAPPGTPPAKVAELRAAFWAMAHDAAFLADAAKLGAVVNAARGEDIQALAEKVYATPKELIAQAADELRRASR